MERGIAFDSTLKLKYAGGVLGGRENKRGGPFSTLEGLFSVGGGQNSMLSTLNQKHSIIIAVKMGPS